MDEILELKPVPVARPWGGACIKHHYGWTANTNQTIGEWWLLCARETGPVGELSVITCGRHASKTLLQVVSLEGHGLMGRRFASGARFPILVKILDTAERLSVQVHPADHHLPGEGKTEAWLILHATPTGHLFLGLKPGVTVDQMFTAAEAGDDVEQLLSCYAAKPGQVAFLPAGLVHALGSGVLALEVQQSSDTTYRIFDWHRLPKRALHLAQAREVVSADQTAAPFLPRVSEPDLHAHVDLVRADAFAMEQFTLQGKLERTSHPDFFECWILIDGEAGIAHARGTHALVPGHAVMVPATLGKFTIAPGRRADLVRITPPYARDARQ